MAVPMRNTWTDERLDDGFQRIDQRFEQVDRRFEQIDHRFDRVEGNLRDLHREVISFHSEVNGRFDDLQRVLMLTGGGVIAALLGVIATQL